MKSIRTKFTLLTVIAIVVALGIATVIGVISIRKLGQSDADQMMHLTATTGAMNLESYFESVEHSVETVATLVQDSLEEMPFEELDTQVERSRNLFGRIANNTNGVLTYYFRIDPEVSENVKGFWYINLDGKGFQEHEVTDITQYDTNDTSALVWFTVPKATGEAVWLPPYITDNLDVRVISYNVPVYWNDRFVGVIGIEIDYETLSREVEKIKIFDTGYAFLLDEDSNVICHPEMDSVHLDLEITAIDDADRAIGENHIQYTYEGVEKEAVWVPLRNGMQLYVSAPVSEIDRGWTGMMRTMLVASLLILLVVVFVTMRFSDHITRPLRKLTEAARQVDQGNYDVVMECKSDDEIGSLSHTFNLLVSHLRTYIKDLKDLAYGDALTAVRNKGAFDIVMKHLQEKIDNPEGEPPAFAVCFFDCNNLKPINDEYGHDKGDMYLKRACKTICQVFAHSPVFRIGGDEFAALLQGTEYEQRDELLETFDDRCFDLRAMATEPWESIDVARGMAVYNPDRKETVEDVIRRADELMYQNKRESKEKQNTRPSPDSRNTGRNNLRTGR
ncbi:MAG: diguanylate cyclase [Candidatus Limivicinus sp.]